jgi:hypothetical protein
MTRTIAVIPARAGSKRVPDKNIRPLSGQPLIVWSIKAALGEPAIDQVIVSTDDVRAASMARELGVTVYDRPRELATDTSSTLDVLRQVGGRYAEERGVVPDVVVLLQPTSPLREADLIRRGLELMHADPAATSLLTVFPVRLFTGVIEDGCWRGNFPETTRSQELTGTRKRLRRVLPGARVSYRSSRRPKRWSTSMKKPISNAPFRFLRQHPIATRIY